MLGTPKVKETVNWFRHHLGLICSDDVYAGTKENLIGSFNRCDRGDTYVDHHVFFALTHDHAGLNHFSFEVQDIDDLFVGHNHLKKINKYEHMRGVGYHESVAGEIDAAWLDRPWPRPAGQQAARLALDSATQGPQPRGLLAALYAHLLAEVGRAPTLDQTAAAFGLSPATFKRRLAAHGTHYQAELDLVRSHVALYLFHFEGCSNEAVARRLGFHDATNFRRSFKRWTGLTPGLLRAGLGMVG